MNNAPRWSKNKTGGRIEIWSRKIKCTTGISPGRLLEGFRKIRSGKAGVPFENTGYNEDQQLRDNIERNNLLKFARVVLNKILTIFKAGDTIKVFFVKN